MTYRTKSLLGFLAAAALFLPAPKTLWAGASDGAPAADVQIGTTQALRSKAEQLFAMANQERAARGLSPLQWDSALANAALTHCARMAAEGAISHQYGGEADVSARAGQAGARFSLIEENVADGDQPARIHQAWMNSQGHRDNLLNPAVDHVGVAVVARGNTLYAVEDFSRSVAELSREQVEARVSRLMEETGVAAHGDSVGARLACADDHGLPASLDNRRPEFIMRWQAAQLSRLPDALLGRISTGKYHEAVVAGCPAQSGQNSFTSYRVAVLLLKPETAGSRTYLSSK